MNDHWSWFHLNFIISSPTLNTASVSSMGGKEKDDFHCLMLESSSSLSSQGAEEEEARPITSQGSSGKLIFLCFDRYFSALKLRQVLVVSQWRGRRDGAKFEDKSKKFWRPFASSSVNSSSKGFLPAWISLRLYLKTRIFSSALSFVWMYFLLIWTWHELFPYRNYETLLQDRYFWGRYPDVEKYISLCLTLEWINW